MSLMRLDKFLVVRGLEPSRERARERILAGEAWVNGLPVTKPAAMVDPGANVVLRGEALNYVSRGGLKLEQALRSFSVPTEGVRAIDVGASTGGFTDCLLQRGAASVHAVDVGYGQLAWKLREDPRVVVMERTNIRSLSPTDFEVLFDLAVIDCSFIGLEKVLPHVAPLVRLGGEVVALVKPQFEAGREGIGKGGVVRDAKVRAAAIAKVEVHAKACGFEIVAGEDCNTHGPSGNVEYLMYLRKHVEVAAIPVIDDATDALPVGVLPVDVDDLP